VKASLLQRSEAWRHRQGAVPAAETVPEARVSPMLTSVIPTHTHRKASATGNSSSTRGSIQFVEEGVLPTDHSVMGVSDLCAGGSNTSAVAVVKMGALTPPAAAGDTVNIYYLLHGGPMQTMAVVKSSLSTWYSKATDTPLLSVPVSRAGYAWKQCTFPADTFLHLCTAAGWNTCVMEGLDEGAVQRVVGLPERYSVPMVISVGYATADAAEHRVPSLRLATSHLIRWNHY